MTINEAVKARHMVRKYLDKPIADDAAGKLRQRIEENNEKYGLDMKLVVNSSDGIIGAAKLIIPYCIYNYVILAGPDCPDLDEKLGRCGADVMLYAQTLGLNSWWVGGMFNAGKCLSHLDENDVRVNGVIAVGYGQTQGVQHHMKAASDISSYEGTAPGWFEAGVEAVLYAPTALNKTAFSITGSGNKVSMTCDNGRYSGIDLGIGKYHFETGAGKENFEWAD